MSWWDSGFSNFASQATQALQKAQKRIDKALDIKEDDTTTSAAQSTSGTFQKFCEERACRSNFLAFWCEFAHLKSVVFRHPNNLFYI